MFVSRFWTLLLALIAGALLAVVLLAQNQLNRERRETATAILYKELDKTDIALNLYARKRLDVLQTISVDPDVRKILAEVSKSPDKAEKNRQKLMTVIRERNQELGKYSADMLMAVDLRGTVIVQVGTGKQEHGYSLSGFPAVDGALLGYIRDDVWKLDNEIYLIAARPVISAGKYVGAVIHAVKVSDKLASDLSPRVQMAFYAGNVMVAVGNPEKAQGTRRAQGAYIGESLDEVLKDKQYLEKGYTDVRKIHTKGGDFLAVYSAVRGEASANQVGLALVTPLEFIVDTTDLYNQAGTQDIQKLPMEWLIGGVLLVTVLGWFWNYIEAGRPLRRLHKHIVALETADPKDQLNIYKFRRRIRKIAASMNKLMDLKVKAVLEATTKAPRSIDSILGTADKERLSSATFKFSEATADDIPEPPPPQTAAARQPLQGRTNTRPIPSMSSSSERQQSGPLAQVQKATPNSPSPVPQSPPNAPFSPQSHGSSSPAQGTAVSVSSPTENEQQYFTAVYKQFMDLKRKLGEDVSQLTFERFEETLKKNRDALVSRFNCTEVRFQVYEKDGKASLKATPIK